MSEPPILPTTRESLPTDDVNPFAPSSAGARRDPSIGTIELGVAYWSVFIAVLFMSAIAIGSRYFIGWGVVASILAAAIRVPLLQRAYPRYHPHSNPANSLVLLCTSWVLVAVFMFVSCITFVVVCVPTSIAFGAPSGFTSSAIAWGSGFAAFICFCTLTYLSLRLPF